MSSNWSYTWKVFFAGSSPTPHQFHHLKLEDAFLVYYSVNYSFMFLIWIVHWVWWDEDRGRIGRFMISNMVRTSAEEHRRLKQGEDIKQELLLLTISVYELDIYVGENKCAQDISWEIEKKGPLWRGSGRGENDIKMDLKETEWEVSGCGEVTG